MNPISIHGLTTEQCDLLDKLWQFNELEDVEQWKETLNAEQQHQVDLLIRLVVLSFTDELVCEDTVQASEYLKKFRL